MLEIKKLKCLKLFWSKKSIPLKLEKQVISLRLESIKFNDELGHDVCVLQLLGRNLFKEFDPREIIATPELLNSLSPPEIIEVGRLIQRIESELNSGQYRIREISLESSVSPDKFIATKIGSNKSKVFSINDFKENTLLLEKFSSKDAFLLGIHQGKLEYIAETKLRTNLNKLAMPRYHSIMSPKKWFKVCG